MKPKEVKVVIYLTVGLAAFIWFVIVWFGGVDPVSYASLKALNGSTAAVAMCWGVYFAWGWKWHYVRRILYRPNLNGTWIGEFKSDWKDANGLGIPPGKFVFVVRQNFFAISIRAFSEKQKTQSYVESLVLDDDRGTKLLAYLYAEKRLAAEDHGPRQGAAELDLVDGLENRLLEGDFWTHSRTTGFIRVRQSDASIQVESFAEAKLKWCDATCWATV